MSTDAVGAELIAARQHLDRADERFAGICDLVIQRNHERGASVRDHNAEQKETFEGGSTRSAKRERYDLIPPEIDSALALRFGLGAETHGENNWKGGGEEFIRGCLNHLRAHYVSLLTNGPWHEDDDIGAMLWNVGVLAWFRAHKPQEFLKALGMQRPVEQINPRLTPHNLSTE